MSNVTVIADEKLGGVEREYAEVKRKADAGDRVKVVNASCTFGDYGSGDVFVVDRRFKDKGIKPANVSGSFGYIGDKEYVALEPSEIVRIDGVRYRMVERKARVGERVIIVEARTHFVRIGEVVTQTGSLGTFYVKREQYADERKRCGTQFIPDPAQYRVLEPKTAAATSAPADDIQRTLDGLTEAIVNLTRRVTELEAAARPEKCEVIASGTVKGGLPSFITRDYAVERAKRDIDVLKVTHHPTLLQYYVARNLTWQPECDAEFIVNSDKRTVVCLLRKRNYNGKGEIQSRGFAKCGPDDVFNVHIGKAIALRRALGLGVPAEYVKTPQPTEVRVGDIVRITGHTASEYHYYDIGDVGMVRKISAAYYVYGIKTQDESRARPYYYQRMQPVDFRVIDDSREEVVA